jgi:hypothetical protein
LMLSLNRSTVSRSKSSVTSIQDFTIKTGRPVNRQSNGDVLTTGIQPNAIASHVR